MFKSVKTLKRSALALLAASAGFAQQYVVSTLAGGAPPAATSQAASVSIGQPRRVFVDSAGNVYFSSLNSVFKLSGGTTLTLVAGNSRAGFSGDRGPAVNAQLNGPQGVAVDSAGNVYIADAMNNRVRVVSSAGIINTFAGNGQPGAYSFLGDNGPAIQANLHLPSGVAVDGAGNVYIADTSNNSIRKVTPDGTITRIAGDTYAGWQGDGGPATSAEFRGPEDVTLDSSGNIYVADTGNGCIRKITTDGNIATIVGALSATAGVAPSIGYSGDNGPATQAGLIEPYSVAVDVFNNIYIAESVDSRIRKVDGKTNIVITIAGNGSGGFGGDGGPSTSAQLSTPTGVAVDTFPNLYVADSLNGRIRKISGGNISTVAGNGVYSYSGDNGPGVKAQLNDPGAVATDGFANVYIADSGNNVVRRVAPDGTITTLAGNGSAGFGGDNGKAASAQLNAPGGVAVDKSNNLYIADTGNQRIRKVAPDGTISTFAGSGTAGSGGDGGPAASAQLNAPAGLAVDASGNLYIADSGNHRIRKVSGGAITTVAGTGAQGYGGDGGPAANAQLNTPQAVAVDDSGNLFIADTNNYVVREVTASNRISTVAGSGVPGYSGDLGPATLAQIGTPQGIAVDKIGAVYISDGATRIRKLFPGGIITTVAGKSTRGYSGDGGDSTNAQFSAPAGLAIAFPGGSPSPIFVADSGNNAVRMLQPQLGQGPEIGSGVFDHSQGVTNAASNLPGPISPGEVVVIYGSHLGPDTLVQGKYDSTGTLSRSAGGASVYFNGTAAPILYASATQVGAVVPYSVSGPTAQALVAYNGQTAAPVMLSVAPANPAIFTLDSSGKGQAAAVNQDGSLAINDAGHPIKIGKYIALYVTGYGETNPPGTDGLPGAIPLPLPVLSVTVTIGGKSATTNYAGQAPQAVAGIMQVNALVPDGVTPGSAVPVAIKVGDFTTQSGVTIAVTN
ncbi:MAG: hypothetical protein LAQ30_01025 [Acidobacteriia bacterium]|nr:hypothetical protein [Terriglobia bacterium]